VDETVKPYTGGCLCGAVRYEATAEPVAAGFCYCADCRKASGSGSIPFILFRAEDIAFTGEVEVFRSPSFRGGQAERNSCPVCASLVFGGVVGEAKMHSVYAGSLDEPSRFHPAIAIFERDRPAWVAPPEGLTVFHTMPE
jgi:hypothetical protein